MGAPAKRSRFGEKRACGNSNGTSALSKARLIAMAAPLAFYLASQGFSMFLASFGDISSVDGQLFVYTSSALMLALEISLFLVGIAFGERISRRALSSNVALRVASLLGFAGLALLLASGQVGAPLQTPPSIAMLVAGLILIALYSAIVIIALGFRISLLDFRDVGFLLGATGCIYAVITFLQALFSQSGAITLGVSCALIAAMAPLFPAAGAGKAASPAQSSSLSYGLLLLFFAGAALGIAAGVFARLFTTPVLGAITMSERSFISYICIIAFFVMTVLFSLLSLSRRTLSLGFSFCAMIFILSLFLAVSFFSVGAREFGTGAIKANQIIFRMYLLVLAVFLAASGRFAPWKAFGLYGIFVLALPEFLINSVVKPINFAFSLHTMNDLLVPATIAFALIATVVVFATIFGDIVLSRKGVASSAAEYERALCEAAALDKGLTARELEVMVYLHRGYNVKKIAEVLCISASTVQSHIASLYRKFGIHSKQELIDAVDETIV